MGEFLTEFVKFLVGETFDGGCINDLFAKWAMFLDDVLGTESFA